MEQEKHMDNLGVCFRRNDTEIRFTDNVELKARS